MYTASPYTIFGDYIITVVCICVWLAFKRPIDHFEICTNLGGNNKFKGSTWQQRYKSDGLIETDESRVNLTE